MEMVTHCGVFLRIRADMKRVRNAMFRDTCFRMVGQSCALVLKRSVDIGRATEFH